MHKCICCHSHGDLRPYGRFIDGESRSERTAALRALARIGRFDLRYVSGSGD